MDNLLQIAADLPMQLDHLIGQRIGVWGTSGMGKSNTVAVLIENLAPHLPIAIIDPHDEYYGLCEKFQFLRAGKAPGVTVEAGPEQAAQLAEFSFTNRVSVILSMLFMDDDERLEFVYTFCSRLWELNLLSKQPYCVVLDEAQNFIPQNGARSSALKKLKQFALEGRKFGFTVILSSQRTAEVNKTILGQCGIAFLHGVDILNDVEAYAGMLPFSTTETKKIVLQLGIGECIVKFKPEGRARFFHPIKINRRQTFDASKTPKSDADALLQKAQPLDAKMIDSLRDLIAQPAVNPDTIASSSVLANIIMPDKPQLATAASNTMQSNQPESDEQTEIARLKEIICRLETELQQLRQNQQMTLPLPAPVAVAAVSSNPPVIPAEKVQLATPTNGKVALNSGAVRILTKLADIHPMLVSRKQIATLTNYTESGGAFNANWSLLKREGFVQEDMRFVSITEDGFVHLHRQPRTIPTTTEDLMMMWREVLKPREYDMLLRLVECYPGAFTVDEMAEACGMTATGGAFNGYIGTLRQNGLIVKQDGQLLADAHSLRMVK